MRREFRGVLQRAQQLCSNRISHRFKMITGERACLLCERHCRRSRPWRLRLPRYHFRCLPIRRRTHCTALDSGLGYIVCIRRARFSAGSVSITPTQQYQLCHPPVYSHLDHGDRGERLHEHNLHHVLTCSRGWWQNRWAGPRELEDRRD